MGMNEHSNSIYKLYSVIKVGIVSGVQSTVMHLNNHGQNYNMLCLSEKLTNKKHLKGLKLSRGVQGEEGKGCYESMCSDWVITRACAATGLLTEHVQRLGK